MDKLSQNHFDSIKTFQFHSLNWFDMNKDACLNRYKQMGFVAKSHSRKLAHPDCNFLELMFKNSFYSLCKQMGFDLARFYSINLDITETFLNYLCKF